MTTLDARGLNAMLAAQKAGKIITQFLGAAPSPATGIVGAIALDSKSNTAYYKTTATTWVAFP